jgi:hypothetical protein
MTKEEIIAALKDTCVMLDERKAQFELMIHGLEEKYAENDDDLAESDNDEDAENAAEDEEEADAANDDKKDEETSGSSTEAAE